VAGLTAADMSDDVEDDTITVLGCAGAGANRLRYAASVLALAPYRSVCCRAVGNAVPCRYRLFWPTGANTAAACVGC